MNDHTLAARHRGAFVTGASTGLGLAFTEMLLAEGLEVWGTSREVTRLPARPRFHPVVLDLTDGPAAEKVFGAADQAAGGFDLVINNAGFGAFGGFDETEFPLWQRQIEVMLVNTGRLAHAAVRSMRTRNRGTLVNISSLAAEFPLPYQAAYNVVKSGLSALSESLMLELEGTGIAVIDFRPGDYRTNFDGAVVRPEKFGDDRQQRAWDAFRRLMAGGPSPKHAAAVLRRALIQGRSGTVRSGRFFQVMLAPLLARFGSLRVRRHFIARYFDL